ncbi:IS66-like element accessory protein TnpA
MIINRSVRLVGNRGRRHDPVWKARLVAACLEPGASVSRLALEHGVNANPIWKWKKKHKETHPIPPSSASAFIPVEIRAVADQTLSRQSRSLELDLPATRELRRSGSEKIGPLSSPAKVDASLPNDVRLTLECGDVEAIAAIIGALSHGQTGR